MSPSLLQFARSVFRGSVAALPSFALTIASTPALAAAPVKSVMKVANGNSSASVDNGWVIFKSPNAAPSVRRYVLDAGGEFTASGAAKLKTAGLGQANAGLLFDVGGIVFAACPVAGGSKCAASDLGTTGVGLGFGQLTFGGAGGQAGGWLNDASLTIRASNPDQIPGSISGVAADPTNGAYAIGWDQSVTTSSNHATLLTLDAAGKTFKIAGHTDLGTLGGNSSQGLGISKRATYVTGVADDANGKKHAVYARTTATAWTDISGGLPVDTLQSRALVASDAGFIAGTATVKRTVNGAKRSVDIGFVYNINTATITTFESPDGADVVPLKVLDDGRVVGNLVYPSADSPVKEQHPFLYNDTLHDYGTMAGAYGCRVNKPNNLGELVGTCIADNSTSYGVNGVAFYLDTTAATPSFINLNTALHGNANATIPSLKPYTFANATSIDDQHEVVVMGARVAGGNTNTAIFLASKQAYTP